MSLGPEYDLRELYRQLCDYNLENKPIGDMDKKDIINLIEIIIGIAPTRCLHCWQYKPETIHGTSGICAADRHKVENYLEFCRIEHDRVPF